MAKIKTNHKVEDQLLSYEVVKDGYDIYLGNTLWITQHEPYIPNKELSYEENAVAQIEEIAAGLSEAEAPEVEETQE